MKRDMHLQATSAREKAMAKLDQLKAQIACGEGGAASSTGGITTISEIEGEETKPLDTIAEFSPMQKGGTDSSIAQKAVKDWIGNANYSGFNTGPSSLSAESQATIVSQHKSGSKLSIDTTLPDTEVDVEQTPSRQRQGESSHRKLRLSKRSPSQESASNINASKSEANKESSSNKDDPPNSESSNKERQAGTQSAAEAGSSSETIAESSQTTDLKEHSEAKSDRPQSSKSRRSRRDHREDSSKHDSSSRPSSKSNKEEREPVKPSAIEAGAGSEIVANSSQSAVSESRAERPHSTKSRRSRREHSESTSDRPNSANSTSSDVKNGDVVGSTAQLIGSDAPEAETPRRKSRRKKPDPSVASESEAESADNDTNREELRRSRKSKASSEGADTEAGSESEAPPDKAKSSKSRISMLLETVQEDGADSHGKVVAAPKPAAAPTEPTMKITVPVATLNFGASIGSSRRVRHKSEEDAGSTAPSSAAAQSSTGTSGIPVAIKPSEVTQDADTSRTNPSRTQADDQDKNSDSSSEEETVASELNVAPRAKPGSRKTIITAVQEATNTPEAIAARKQKIAEKAAQKRAAMEAKEAGAGGASAQKVAVPLTISETKSSAASPAEPMQSAQAAAPPAAWRAFQAIQAKAAPAPAPAPELPSEVAEALKDVMPASSVPRSSMRTPRATITARRRSVMQQMAATLRETFRSGSGEKAESEDA
jgi:hypothetical protein